MTCQSAWTSVEQATRTNSYSAGVCKQTGCLLQCTVRAQKSPRLESLSVNVHFHSLRTAINVH